MLGVVEDLRSSPPESIRTSAAVTLEKLDAGWTVTAVHLDVSAKVPKADYGSMNLRRTTTVGKAGVGESVTIDTPVAGMRERDVDEPRLEKRRRIRPGLPSPQPVGEVPGGHEQVEVGDEGSEIEIEISW